MTKLNFATPTAFFFLILFTLSATAQETNTNEKSEQTAETKISAEQSATETPYRLRRGTKEYNFELGVAPFNPTKFGGPDEYDRTGRSFAGAHFRVGRVIGTKRNVTYTYLFGFTPLVVAFGNEATNRRFVSAAATPNEPPTVRETSYGAGMTPANFRFTFLAKNKIKPFAQTGAGFLIFNKSMPLPESRRLQFTGDFGGGVIYHVSPDKMLLFGWKYYHISNGNFTVKKYNVGYNAQTFYVGLSFLK